MSSEIENKRGGTTTYTEEEYLSNISQSRM